MRRTTNPGFRCPSPISLSPSVHPGSVWLSRSSPPVRLFLLVPSPAYLRTAGTLAPEPVLLPSLSHLTILPALQLREVRVSKVLVFFLSFDLSPRRLCWLARLRFSKTLSTYRTGRILRTEE